MCARINFSRSLHRRAMLGLHDGGMVAPTCSQRKMSPPAIRDRMETPMDDNFLFAIFSPDETLSCDSTYNYAQWRQCEPERNLLAAVLKDALLTYKKRFSLGDARFREVERWLFSEDSDGLFAFQSVCSMLNLSADRIRKDLRVFAGAVGESSGFGQPRRSRTVRSHGGERAAALQSRKRSTGEDRPAGTDVRLRRPKDLAG